jgi:hypothetical protein
MHYTSGHLLFAFDILFTVHHILNVVIVALPVLETKCLHSICQDVCGCHGQGLRREWRWPVGSGAEWKLVQLGMATV